MESKSQVGQDIFIRKCLNFKNNGTFLEIGSYHPILINNTYILEKEHHWRGIMVDYSDEFVEEYKIHRSNSKWIINDARNINYCEELQNFNMPSNIDYLQIDLEVSNNSTLSTLNILNDTVMDKYKFSVVTFEHDIYSGNYFNTRLESRRIFEEKGYIRVFSDVKNNNSPFEDWYVFPEFVDMNFINKIKTEESLEYSDIIKLICSPKINSDSV